MIEPPRTSPAEEEPRAAGRASSREVKRTGISGEQVKARWDVRPSAASTATLAARGRLRDAARRILLVAALLAAAAVVSVLMWLLLSGGSY